MEIKWTDEDDETGERRFVRAERFAGVWGFSIRRTRRSEWERVDPDRDMLESLIEALERRVQRKEGVEDADVERVRRLLSAFREPPSV